MQRQSNFFEHDSILNGLLYNLRAAHFDPLGGEYAGLRIQMFGLRENIYPPTCGERLREK